MIEPWRAVCEAKVFTWTHVGSGPSSSGVGAYIRRQTEVAQDDLPPIRRNKDVLWLQVLVEYPSRMHEIDCATDLKDNFPRPSIVSRKRVSPCGNVRPQVASRTIVQNQEHLFAARDVEIFVESNDVGMGRQETVVMYLAYGLV